MPVRTALSRLVYSKQGSTTRTKKKRIHDRAALKVKPNGRCDRNQVVVILAAIACEAGSCDQQFQAVPSLRCREMLADLIESLEKQDRYIAKDVPASSRTLAVIGPSGKRLGMHVFSEWGTPR